MSKKQKLGCDVNIDKKRITDKYIPLPRDLANIIVDYFYEEWYTLYTDGFNEMNKMYMKLYKEDIKDKSEDFEKNIVNRLLSQKIKQYVHLDGFYTDGYSIKKKQVGSKYKYIFGGYHDILPVRYPIEFSEDHHTLESYHNVLLLQEIEKKKKKIEELKILSQKRMEEARLYEEWKIKNPPRPPEIITTREWADSSGRIVYVEHITIKQKI